jgi:hypothetical protein
MKIYPIIRDVCCVLGLALLGNWRERWLLQHHWMQGASNKSLVRGCRTIRKFAPPSGGWRPSGHPQVRTLPDPLINLGYDKVDGRAMYGFSQEIPFQAAPVTGEVATREAERMEQEYLAVPCGPSHA